MASSPPMSAVETTPPAAPTSEPSPGTAATPAAQAAPAHPAPAPVSTAPTPPAEDGDAPKKLAAENQSLRARLRELEEAEQKRAEAEMSELERAQKRADDAEQRAALVAQQARDHRLRADIATIGQKLGLAAPADDVARLLDLAAVEVDADGYPVDVEKLLADLVEQRPYLKGAAAPVVTGGAAANPPSGGPASRGTFTKTQLADRAFYEQHRAEIEVAMREGRIVPG